jgi:ATP-dependent Clp protease ATP-binding subunit ClpB
MNALIDNLRSLETALKCQIIGQDEPLRDIAALLRRACCGCRYPDQPMASMLLLGPTGVGKTETVRLFTHHMCGDVDKLVRLDMSEFMTLDSIDLLRGANAADPGLLGLYVKRSGGSGTLLFDEIEKAHPLIRDIFLQILSAGRFTLATGETLDLSRYIVVATSNVGAYMIAESRTQDRDRLEKRTLQAATDDIRLETLGRFDLIAVYNKLSRDALAGIARFHTDAAVSVLNCHGHDLTVEQGVAELVQRLGYSEQFGARPIRQAAMQILGDLVADEMLKTRGEPVRGTVRADQRTNRCFLVPK